MPTGKTIKNVWIELFTGDNVQVPAMATVSYVVAEDDLVKEASYDVESVDPMEDIQQFWNDQIAEIREIEDIT